MAKRRTKPNPKNDNSKNEDEKKKKMMTKKSLPGPCNSVAMKSKGSKENTFDTIWLPRTTRSGMQRSDPSGSAEKRKLTQLEECEQIGEQFDDLGEFAKAIVRFQRETQLRLNKKYDLCDGEEHEFAIQGGGALSERDNFEDDMMSLDGDADADTNVDADTTTGEEADANMDAEANGMESVILSNMASPESSKQARDRARKESSCIPSPSKNAPTAGFHVLEQEDSNDLGGEDPNEFPKEMSNPSKNTQKTTKTRGPTKCNAVVMESGNRIEVQLNNNGQPIEKPSEILSSYVGHLARNMVPITYNDWRKIPNESKEYYWQEIKQKFTFNRREEEAKIYVLQEMGRLWRSHKSRLGAKLEIKPHNIDSEEWQTFIQQRSSEKFKEKSTKFKEMRKRQSIPYTGSRKGFARMEEEIKKEGPVPESKLRLLSWLRGYTNKDGEATNPEAAELVKRAKELLASHPSESSPTPYVKDDALPPFLGPKKRFKVSPSKLYAGTKNTGEIVELEEKIVSLKGKVDEMSSLVAKQKNLIDTLMNKRGRDQPEHSVQNIHSRDLTTTPQIHDGRTNRVSRKCKLINWIVPDEVVAIGRWVSNDPKIVVHCVPLGRNASRVWIDEVEQPSAPLWRATSNIETMEEAMGSAIAWPTDHLIMMD